MSPDLLLGISLIGIVVACDANANANRSFTSVFGWAIFLPWLAFIVYGINQGLQ